MSGRSLWPSCSECSALCGFGRGLLTLSLDAAHHHSRVGFMAGQFLQLTLGRLGLGMVRVSPGEDTLLASPKIHGSPMIPLFRTATTEVHRITGKGAKSSPFNRGRQACWLPPLGACAPLSACLLSPKTDSISPASGHHQTRAPAAAIQRLSLSPLHKGAHCTKGTTLRARTGQSQQ